MKNLVTRGIVGAVFAIMATGMLMAQSSIVARPTTMPVGAYGNGGDGDKYFMQQVEVTLSATPSNGHTVIITLPTGITIPDLDETNGVDEVYIANASSGAAAIMTVASSASVITITIGTANGLVLGDKVYAIFPVATDTAEATGLTYTAVLSTGGQSGTSNAVALDDTVTLATFDGTFFTANGAGGATATDTRGRSYPDGTAAPATYTGNMPQFIVDANSTNELTVNAVSNWLPGVAALGNSADGDAQVSFSLWLSQTSDLKRISAGSGQLAVNFTNNVVMTAAFDGAPIVSTNPGHLKTNTLAEGIWYAYITSDATTDWVLAQSDSFNVVHRPTFVDLATGLTAVGAQLGAGDGVDADHDGFFEPKSALLGSGTGGDDVTLTAVESGGTVGRDGLFITATNPVFDNVNIHWNIEDVDDNARIHVFISTSSTLDSGDVVTSGGVVTGLTGATELTTTAIFEEGITDFINWDIFTDASTFETAGDYFAYIVAYDGNNFAMNKVGDETGSALTIRVKHSPFFKFHDVTIAADAGIIDTGLQRYLTISWGETVDGDKDPDAAGTAVIKLYWILEAGNPYATVVATDPTNAADLLYLQTNGNLIATITDTSDTQEQNSYMWDLKAASLADANIDLWAHIAHGSDNLIVQYNTSTSPVLAGTPDDRTIDINHSPNMFPSTPVEGTIVELNQDDRFEFTWESFDINATAANTNVAIFMAPTAGLTNTFATENAANTAGTYWLTSTDGIGPDASVNSKAQSLIVDFNVLVNSASGAGGRPSGDFFVYYYYSSDGTEDTETAVETGGRLRVNPLTATATNFEMNPNSAIMNEGDTVTVTIFASENSSDDPEFLNIYLDVSATNFTVIDQDGATAGVQPFLDDVSPFSATVIENTVTTVGSTQQINFVKWDATGTGININTTLVSVGSIQLIAATAASGSGLDDNELNFAFSGSRTTGMIGASGLDLAMTVPAVGAHLYQPAPGQISGIVDLEGRSDQGTVVTVKVSPEGSLTPITNSAYVTANDDDADGTNGVGITLGSGGTYTLTSVPAGEYDVTVHFDGYLNQVAARQRVYSVATTTINFDGTNKLLGGDVAGYDHDGDAGVTTFSRPDNDIDSDDTDAISTAFGTTSADALWNAFADVDGSGTVDVTDLNLSASNLTAVSEGPTYKVGAPRNGEVITGLDLIAQHGDEYTYSVSAIDLGSLHAYQVAMNINSNDWEFVSFGDGMSQYKSTVSLYRLKGAEAIMAGAIYGYESITFRNTELFSFTLRALNGPDSKGPEMVYARIIDGNGYMTSAIIRGDASLPSEFTLAQNFPNPFNPTTTINFTVAREANVSLSVYNLLGQEVTSLVSGTMTPGSYKAVWNAMDQTGRKVSTGLYFYRLIVDNKVLDTRKMMLLK